MLGLLIVTVIVAVYSEFLVSSIDGMCEAYKVGPPSTPASRVQ
jgi:Ca2+/H+ antiporter